MVRFERGVGIKQRIKQFPFTVTLCLTLAVLIPFSAFVKIDQKVLGFAEQGAEKNISIIMSFNEAILQNYIDQSEINGEAKMADGLKSWQAIRGGVGDVTAVDDAVAKEVDDDNTLATAKAHCGDRGVVAHLGYQISSGDITELNFSKAETLGERLESARLNLTIGIDTVFTVLIFIAFLISRFKYIHDWVSRKETVEKEEREYKEKVAAIRRIPKSAKDVSKRISTEQVKATQVPGDTKVQHISVPEETVTESESIPAKAVAMLAATVAASKGLQLDPQMLAALIVAALAAEGKDPGPDGLVVKSLRRRGDSKRRKH